MAKNCVPDHIEIEGVKFVPQINTTPTKRVIIIAQRGWNLVGDYSICEDTGDIILSNASVIRIWGTTKGIGQLALEGPTSSTKLDPCGTARFRPEAIVGRIDVVSSL